MLHKESNKICLIRKFFPIYIMFLLILTLNPYDFSISYFKHLAGYDFKNFIEFIFHVNIWDVALNIILFIPFGVLVFLYQKEKSGINRIKYLKPIIFAFFISLFIEIVQLFLERSTSIIDITTNSFGSFLGTYLANNHKKIIFQIIRSFSVDMKLGLRRFFAYFYILFLFIAALIPYKLNGINSWIESYKLILGNEATLDRPWTGSIYKIAIYKKALDKTEIKSLYDNKIDNFDFNYKNMKCIALYDFNREPDTLKLSEVLNNSIAFKLSGKHYKFKRNSINIQDGYLKTYLPVRDLYKEIKETNQFSIEVRIKTNRLDQKGPARIVSVSKDPEQRNFTLAQQGRDVHFRVRTVLAGKNGTRINLREKNILQDTSAHHIVVTFNHGVERIALDGIFRNQIIRGDINYIPFILRLGTNVCSRISLYLLLLVPLGIFVYGLGGLLREEKVVGFTLIFIFFIQTFYFVKAGQPYGLEFFTGGIGAALLSIFIGRTIKAANLYGCFNQ